MKKIARKCTALLALFAILLCLCACASQENHTAETKAVRATVVEIEQFGHAVLNLTTEAFSSAGYELGDVVCVRFGTYAADMPFFDGYYVKPGAVMLRGLTPEKNIAVCINYGDFSTETGLAIGDTVEITMAEKAGMLALQELYGLTYSNNPADYSGDAAFANFRPVTAGCIGSGKLYRSSSPINNEIGRAAYANRLIADAGVNTILNLADSKEEIVQHCEAADFASEYYRTLFEAGKVIALDLAANFYADKFAASLVEGLRFLSQNDPPYSVHCTEGKDRAGFTVMLLEALMGADLQEIIDDYMLSFYNYYGIDKETEPARYEAVLNNNLIPMLCHVTGADSYETLEQTDLKSAVTNYLIRNGMAETDILALTEKLR